MGRRKHLFPTIGHKSAQKLNQLGRLVHVDTLLANVELCVLRIVHILQFHERRVFTLIAQRTPVAGENCFDVRPASETIFAFHYFSKRQSPYRPFFFDFCNRVSPIFVAIHVSSRVFTQIHASLNTGECAGVFAKFDQNVYYAKLARSTKVKYTWLPQHTGKLSKDPDFVTL
jgi:hypothetical protein